MPSSGAALDLSVVFDGDACHARPVAPLSTHRPLRIDDSIGPQADDELDVFRTRAEPGSYALKLVSTGDEGATIDLIEAGSGKAVVHATAGTTVFVEVAEPTSLDLVVAAGSARTRYRLTVEHVDSPGAVDARVPLADHETGVRTLAQCHYLGAQHEMVPGEIVVMLAAQPVGVDTPEFRADVIGVAAIRAAGGDREIGLYRIASPTIASVAAGAAPEQSLETETCLVAKRLEHLPGVRAASPNYIRRALQRTPNDPLFSKQWHFQILRMDLAWDITQGSDQVVVAIADTGIVSAHPDFVGRLSDQGFDFISDPTNARDGDGMDSDPEDPGDLATPVNSSWHGTHVAGTIGARTDDGVGVAGMDWACKLVPLRVLGLNGGTSSDIIEAVRYSAGLANASGRVPTGLSNGKSHVDVLNMSLGGAGSSTVEQNVYQQVRDAGVLVVCAAGNDPVTTPGFPASYPSNLSVGSVRFDKTRAFYSNQATTVDIMAPGGDMLVDQNGDQLPDGVLSTLRDDRQSPPFVFAFEMGTSMASPHVAGLASLILAGQPTATPAIIESLLRSNAEDLGATGSDPIFHDGLIAPLPTLRAAASLSPTNPILSTNPVAVSFGNIQTQTSVELVNVGIQTTRLEIASVTVTFDGAATGWLATSLVASPSNTTISHERLDLTVDRTGLADGNYAATIAFNFPPGSTTPPTSVSVAIEVGAASVDDEFFIVLALPTAEGGFETIAEAKTTSALNLAYSLIGTDAEPIADGEYLLAAGTDRDKDGFIGDDGELFGKWPLMDSTESLAVTESTHFQTGLDFAVLPVGNQTASTGSRRTIIKIRR